MKSASGSVAVSKHEQDYANPSQFRFLRWFFLFFFISGFCSLLYEVVWLRLAMAELGVTSALVSIVLSTFMAGLGLGSWLSGYWIRKSSGVLPLPALRLYACIELAIGISPLLVPRELAWGRAILEKASFSSSVGQYAGSAIWIALALIPWCACMGATIPVGMLALRQLARGMNRSFSFLYLSNVCGAVSGALLPLLCIEIWGFRGTLKIGAALNVLIALVAYAASIRIGVTGKPLAHEVSLTPSVKANRSHRELLLLFATGLTSMGIEVIWIRQFTPYLNTMVYAFASILALYLLSTFVGSRFYRAWSTQYRPVNPNIWALLGLFALLPLASASPELYMSKGLRLLLGVVPFSGTLGFVTPMLVDRWSEGDPDRAGTAYALNIIGCILGPLLAGFILLPLLSERWALFLLALPWLVVGFFENSGGEPDQSSGKNRQRYAFPSVLAVLSIVLLMVGKPYEDLFAEKIVRRDHTATIVATGTGLNKRLLVNGIGITVLTPATKVMAHLPLMHLDHTPQRALVICFGMGTTYRSLMSWNIPVTAVELVPSVPKVFGYYHADATQLMRSPLSHIVIDDGRRYLERTSEQYDVITLDPPPPVQAAGSSLLYSKEFYATARQRLLPGGILQQWLPEGDAAVKASVAGAIKDSFPYVRAFHWFDNNGTFFLASNRPLPYRSASELVSRMPDGAMRDLTEWTPRISPQYLVQAILLRELRPESYLLAAPYVPPLRDNKPTNEYYVLRKWLPVRWQYLLWSQ